MDFADQPPNTIPYSPSAATASTKSIATGESVSCSGVWIPKMDTSGPIGITAIAEKAQIAVITGATRYTTFSAPASQKSSFSSSFRASGNDCPRPNGPTVFGPTRFWKRAIRRRSNQSAKITEKIKNTTMNSALITDIHHVSWEKSAATCVKMGFTSLPPLLRSERYRPRHFLGKRYGIRQSFVAPRQPRQALGRRRCPA